MMLQLVFHFYKHSTVFGHKESSCEPFKSTLPFKTFNSLDVLSYSNAMYSTQKVEATNLNEFFTQWKWELVSLAC